MKKAYTLLEIIIVIAIVLIIAAVLAAVFSSAKVQAKHTVCASQMKQLYFGLAQYAADNDAESLYPELHGHSYYIADLLVTGSLSAYKPVMKCPSAPTKFAKAVWSTYMLTGLVPSSYPTTGPTGPYDPVKIVKELEQKLGEDIPIIECAMHDETEYRPREGKSGNPWLQWITSQGVLKRGKVTWRQRFPVDVDDMVK